MEQNVQPTTTTVGMLGHTDVLSDGQANTITYNTDDEKINQPTPASDPIQNLWKNEAVANQLGIVEQEEPEVKDETPTLGDETLKAETTED